MAFFGYVREDGSVGLRNYVIVLPTVPCVNLIAKRIAEQVEQVVPITHNVYDNPNLDPKPTRTKIGLGKNPNVAAVLIVGMGCERGGCATEAEKLAEKIADSEKPIKTVTVEKEGGTYKTIKKGVKIASEFVQYASEIKKEEVELGKLTLGIKCGASDATSGIASNPAVGATADMIIHERGTVIFSETSEMIGAEHILAKRAVDQKVRQQIYEIVNRVRNRIEKAGVDIRGVQPNKANIDGGISTIEEKALGAIIKGGTAPIQGVLEYAERPSTKGLFIMDSIGNTKELLTGLTAAGAQIIVFSLGGQGLPGECPTIPGSVGPPIAPVVIVTGNCKIYKDSDHLDVYVGTIMEGRESFREAGERILKKIIDAASGRLTKLETIKYMEPIDAYTTFTL
jgi:altronate dehydratase large subunit